MQHKWFLVVAGVALAWNSTAHGGVPAWCKQPSDREYSADASDDPRDNVARVVAGCGPHAGAAWDKAYAEYSKQYVMNDADWAAAAEWNESSGRSNSVTAYKPVATTFATLSPVDQYLLFAQVMNPAQGSFDAIYLADALEPNLSQAGRVGFLLNCVNEDVYDFPVYWAICQEDAAAIDVAKLADEIRNDKTQPAVARTAAKLSMWKTLAKVKASDAKYADLIKKDDAYKKLVDVATKGRADWVKQLGDKKDLLALAQQVDSATYFHSKKQFAGCEEPARKRLAEAAATIPAKSLGGFDDAKVTQWDKTFAGMVGPILAASPQMNVAMTAYALCLPTTATAGWFAESLREIPGFRGPRDAAFDAITLEKFELDDTKAKEIQKPKPASRPYDRMGEMARSYGGVVAKLKPDGDHVVVSEPKSSVTTEDCVSWHETNKIQGWDTAGRLVYQSVCTKTSAVKHDTTPSDDKISAATAVGLKPGMRFEYIGGYNDTNADIVATWPKGAKLPGTLLGGKIK